MSLKKIKDLFHFEKGSLQSTKATPGDFDFITAAADWKTHNEFTHDCEALIFAAAASGSLGRTHYVNGKFISSDLCFIITPKDPDKYPIDLKFYHLIFEAFKDEIVRNTKSGTSKEAIGLTVFGKYELPYFDIDKQVETRNKFVNAQKSTNKIDSELTYQLDLLTQLRQAYLREAMQGKLVPQDSNNESASILLERIKAEKEVLVKEKKIKKQKPLSPITEEEIPFDIPENWVWCRLGEIVEHTFYGPRFSNSDYVKSGVPTIRTTDMSESGLIEIKDAPMVNLTSQSKIDLYKIDYNDLLITRTGSIGTMALFKSDYLAIPSAYLIRCRFMIPKMADFLFRFLKSDYSLNYFGLNTKTGTRPNINAVSISNLIISLPPLSEQQRIVSKLDELMGYCDDLEESIIESQLQNDLLLKQVLTEALGLKPQKVERQKTSTKMKERKSKFDPNTTLMEIVELLNKHGKLHAEELWKMSKYPNDIDAFYAELKKQIELNKLVKESKEKGYLELV